MAVIGSRDFTIGCATNIVHGDQHNQTINIRFGARRAGKQRQVQRKEDELELIDQYRKIPLGDIYKIKQIGSSEVWEEERDEDGRLVSKCIGKRTYYHAKLYGDDKVYIGVTYSGKDVFKLWKEDFVKYSSSHNLSDSAMSWQLLGINCSKIPALIFYNECLPTAHFCPNPDKDSYNFSSLRFMAALAAAAIQLNIESTNNATVSSILVLPFLVSFIAS